MPAAVPACLVYPARRFLSLSIHVGVCFAGGVPAWRCRLLCFVFPVLCMCAATCSLLCSCYLCSGFFCAAPDTCCDLCLVLRCTDQLDGRTHSAPGPPSPRQMLLPWSLYRIYALPLAGVPRRAGWRSGHTESFVATKKSSPGVYRLFVACYLFLLNFVRTRSVCVPAFALQRL